MLIESYIFFRIITLILISGSILYLFKKYGLIYIKKEIKLKEDFFENLKKEKEILIQDQIDIEKDIEEEEEHISILKNKLLQWKKEFSKELLLKRMEADKNNNKVKQNLKKQKEQLELLYAQKKVSSKVIDQLTLRLKNNFKKEINKENFVENIIRYLKKQK